MPFVDQFRPESVIGVDFSGAAKAGKNAWIARTEVAGRGLRLMSLGSLENICGEAGRDAVLSWLVNDISTSDKCLWGMDFPFSLPEALGFGSWKEQLEEVARFPEASAPAFGRQCVAVALERSGKMHIRRQTDLDTKTPFDCYHYRIVYQMFHGMRDVLLPLSRQRFTAVLPFEKRKLASAKRVVVEACPSSTLKRWGVPHHRYKQAGKGPITPEKRQVRLQILSRILQTVKIPSRFRQVILDNPGGDALDAVVAAAGAWEAWNSLSSNILQKGSVFAREGMIFA